jgi:hypothetical protein
MKEVIVQISKTVSIVFMISPSQTKVLVRGKHNRPKNCRNHAKLMFEGRWLCFAAHSPMKAMGHKNGKDHLFSRTYVGSIFQRIQIGPQLMPGNTRNALNSQHSKRRNFIPLRNSLCGHTNQARKLGLPTHIFDREV